jgi:hypothetical protein
MFKIGFLASSSINKPPEKKRCLSVSYFFWEVYQHNVYTGIVFKINEYQGQWYIPIYVYIYIYIYIYISQTSVRPSHNISFSQTELQRNEKFWEAVALQSNTLLRASPAQLCCWFQAPSELMTTFLFVPRSMFRNRASSSTKGGVGLPELWATFFLHRISAGVHPHSQGVYIIWTLH